MTEPMPLCPVHEQKARRAGIALQDIAGPCPLCAREKYAAYLLCGHCATEAGVCVFDALPLDGSSDQPPSWLTTLAAGEQAARNAAPRPSAHELRRQRTQRPLIGTWHVRDDGDPRGEGVYYLDRAGPRARRPGRRL